MSITHQHRLSCFAGDSVTEIDHGNTRITRGQFGEIALAIWEEQVTTTTTTTPAHDDDRSSLSPPCITFQTNRVVAVKTLYQAMAPTKWGSTERYLCRDVYNEIVALQHLAPHPHIVQLLALYPNRDDFGAGSSLSMAFDYCPVDLHFSLEWRRRTFRPLLSFAILQTIANDTFRALDHCHSHGIIHGDVKPGNLLVSSRGLIQLCDFGLAHLTHSTLVALGGDDDDATTEKGNVDLLLPPPIPVDGNDPQPRELCTLHYRPPELLLGASLGRGANATVDIWSAGVTLAELLTGRALFPGRNVIDQLCCVFAGVGTPTDSHYPAARTLPDYGKLHFAPKPHKSIQDLLPRSCECPEMLEFLSCCIALDPEQRASASTLLHQSSWLKNVFSSSDTEPRPPRSHLLVELVPSELDEPILLSDSDNTQPLLELAARRRSLLQTATERALLTAP